MKNSGTSKNGIALIMPTLERGIDPHGTHKTAYKIFENHIKRIGYTPHLVDPRNVKSLRDVMLSPSIRIIMTNRSQANFWVTFFSEGEIKTFANDKILICMQGNPPFFPGSIEFHNSPFKKKIALFIDHDAIDFAESCNTSSAIIKPLQPAFHDIGIDEEEFLQSASQRKYPILFVGTYNDPIIYRQRWTGLFSQQKNFLHAIECASEMIESDYSMSVIKALSKAVEPFEDIYRLNSRAGIIALELLARFANNFVRQKIIQKLVRYPSFIISPNLPNVNSFHPGCRIEKSIPFSEYLELMKSARCVVSSNANHMTGAITERVTNSMRRGAVILNTPNSLLEKFNGYATINIGSQIEYLDEWVHYGASGDD